MTHKDEVDETDLKILNIIKRDARLSFREIGKKLNLSTGTVSDRIKLMQANGVIRGFVTAMDHEKLGYQVSLMMCIRLSPGVPRQKIEEELSKLEDMCCMHSVTGEMDISVLARAMDQSHSAEIIDQVRSIKGVDRVDSHVVLRSMTMCGSCGCDCGWTPPQEAKE